MSEYSKTALTYGLSKEKNEYFKKYIEFSFEDVSDCFAGKCVKQIRKMWDQWAKEASEK